MRKNFARLLVAILCVGCSFGYPTRIFMVPLAGLTPQRAALCPAAVKVYASSGGVQSRYTELAIVSARSGLLYDESKQRAVVAELQAKAAALGANGLIVGEFRQSTIQATAIWIPADSASAAAACGTRG